MAAGVDHARPAQLWGRVGPGALPPIATRWLSAGGQRLLLHRRQTASSCSSSTSTGGARPHRSARTRPCSAAGRHPWEFVDLIAALLPSSTAARFAAGPAGGIRGTPGCVLAGLDDRCTIAEEIDGLLPERLQLRGQYLASADDATRFLLLLRHGGHGADLRSLVTSRVAKAGEEAPGRDQVDGLMVRSAYEVWLLPRRYRERPDFLGDAERTRLPRRSQSGR